MGGIYQETDKQNCNFVTVQTLGIDVSDFTNSFRIYKRKTFQNLISNVENMGFAFQMEIMVRAGGKQ